MKGIAFLHLSGAALAGSALMCTAQNLTGDVTRPTFARCGQYQHLEYKIMRCAHPTALVMCPMQDVCVDDMHEVTEAQWQALQHALDLVNNMLDIEEKQIMAVIAAAESMPPKKEEHDAIPDNSK